MRDYGKVHTSFWTSDDMRRLSDDGRMLAFYLLTSPHTSLIGAFRLPDAYVTEDMQWTSARVAKAFSNLDENRFATRDESSKWVVIHRFLRWNPIENPNQGKAATKLFAQVTGPIARRDAARALLALGGPMVDPTGIEALANPLATLCQPTFDPLDPVAEPLGNPPYPVPVPSPDSEPNSTPSEPSAPKPLDEVWRTYFVGAREAGRNDGQLSARTPARDQLVRLRIADCGLERVLAAARGVWVDPWAKPGGTCGKASGRCAPEYAFRNAERVETYAASWEEHGGGTVARARPIDDPAKRERDESARAEMLRQKRAALGLTGTVDQ